MTEHKNVWVALAAAQAEFPKIIKGAKNNAFKKPDGSASTYADLADLVDASRPALNKHGLCVWQTVRENHMVSILTHGASETHIECPIPLYVDRQNMHGFKSATTYAKRIGYESVTGIAPDDDDDGNAAAKAPPLVEKHSSNEGLRDAWRDAVLDQLPPDASPRDKAEAFALAIIMDFAVKTEKTLEGRWSRHAKMIESMADKHPDLHGQIVDAFENKMMELTESKVAAQ